MNYNRIQLNRSLEIVGLQTNITSYTTAPMQIGTVWQQFFKSIHEISDQTPNKNVYAVYTNYKNNQSMETIQYQYLVGIEVTSLKTVSKHMSSINLPPAAYAHYAVTGPMPISLISFWQTIWQTKLDYTRAFTADYEIHSLVNKELVDVYIAIQE